MVQKERGRSLKRIWTKLLSSQRKENHSHKIADKGLRLSLMAKEFVPMYQGTGYLGEKRLCNRTNYVTEYQSPKNDTMSEVATTSQHRFQSTANPHQNPASSLDSSSRRLFLPSR